VNNAFAEVISSSHIPVLDLAMSYRALSERMRRTVAEMVDDEYGLEIPQLHIVNISLPAEVERALDARTSMGVVGDLGAFQAYQMGSAMPVAAANPAGGLAGAGLGMGMGMAMAQPMMAGTGGMQGPMGGGGHSPAPPPAVAPPPPPPLPTWHLAENGEAVGPFTQPQLMDAVTSGRLRPDTLVWRAGMQGWTQAGETPELQGLFG